jgi:hypothetical protein
MWLAIGSRVGSCKNGNDMSIEHNKQHSTEMVTVCGRNAMKGQIHKNGLVCFHFSEYALCILKKEY